MTNEQADNFLGAYFHQDWSDEANSDGSIVRLFVTSGVSKSEIDDIACQLEDIARRNEDRLDENWLYDEYGCYYNPKPDGLTNSMWLRRIANLLREEWKS